jgi:hypothetical protein
VNSREIGARFLVVAGAALLVVGFFLPWMDGTAEFSARDFSGFDLARLVRNFEIATDGDEGRLRVATVVLYAVPALAVNAAAFVAVPGLRVWERAAVGIAFVYALVVLVGVAVLASVGWTDLEGVLGRVMVGWWMSLVGVVAMGVGGFVAWVAPPPRPRPV